MKERSKLMTRRRMEMGMVRVVRANNMAMERKGKLEGATYTEPYSAPFSSNFKDSGSARGDWKDNEYSQLTHGSPIVAQTWNNFSLPRSRQMADLIKQTTTWADINRHEAL
ncbi:Uncharacterized protein Fot_23240 [Forsythia ovata]|uniref:Uncharacterized protein n=1 Tax=Forsythia ovata TaxID=205694 RepID=A0ABD1UZZ3_9LAMI